MTPSSTETDIPADVPVNKRRLGKSYKLTAYLPLFILTMMSGLAVLFFGHHISFLPDLDISCVRAATPSKDRLYDLDRDTKTITARLLTIQPDAGRNFRMLEITDDPDQVYESTPPSPLDYAVMLHTLKEKGAENIILTTRMSWDGDSGLSADALSIKLSAFNRATIALPLTRGSTAQELPNILRQSVIPFSNIRGNIRLIPVVNQVALPAVLAGNKNVYAGFSKIESTPESSDFLPMICHWENEGLIPSLELLALMNAHSVTPAEVLVRSGRHIRLGIEGPVVPINSYGEILLPEMRPHQLHKIPTIKAEDLITRPSETKTAATDPSIYLVHAVGEKSKATNTLSPRRLAAVINWSQNLPAPEPGKSIPYHRLPLWADIVILFDIALAACWFAGFTRSGRHLAFVLAAALIFPLLLSVMDITQHWISVSAPLIALFMAWLIPVKKRKHTTTIQEYHTASPKPVLRA